MGVAHPGLPVGPAAQRSLRPQPLRGGEPVALQAAGEIGDVAFERIHRRRRRHRHQRRRPRATSASRTGSSTRAATRAIASTCPAATAPDANASCSTGSSSHSAPRAATTRTSRDARPGVSTSGTDNRAAQVATVASTASSQPRTCRTSRRFEQRTAHPRCTPPLRPRRRQPEFTRRTCRPVLECGRGAVPHRTRIRRRPGARRRGCRRDRRGQRQRGGPLGDVVPQRRQAQDVLPVRGRQRGGDPRGGPPQRHPRRRHRARGSAPPGRVAPPPVTDPASGRCARPRRQPRSGWRTPSSSGSSGCGWPRCAG